MFVNEVVQFDMKDQKSVVVKIVQTKYQFGFRKFIKFTYHRNKMN